MHMQSISNPKYLIHIKSHARVLNTKLRNGTLLLSLKAPVDPSLLASSLRGHL